MLPTAQLMNAKSSYEQAVGDFNYLREQGIGAFLSKQGGASSTAVNNYMDGVENLHYCVSGGRNSWSFHDVDRQRLRAEGSP